MAVVIPPAPGRAGLSVVAVIDSLIENSPRPPVAGFILVIR